MVWNNINNYHQYWCVEEVDHQHQSWWVSFGVFLTTITNVKNLMACPKCKRFRSQEKKVNFLQHHWNNGHVIHDQQHFKWVHVLEGKEWDNIFNAIFYCKVSYIRVLVCICDMSLLDSSSSSQCPRHHVTWNHRVPPRVI
jgi:hypothetical protein